MCFASLCAGVSPGQEFTAVINAVSPLVSQSQPIMKLLQVVSKSKYCSQVTQHVLWENLTGLNQFTSWNRIFIGAQSRSPLINFDADFKLTSTTPAGDWLFLCSGKIRLFQIIILWNSEKPQPSRSKWPPMPVPLTVTDGRRKVRKRPACLRVPGHLWAQETCIMTPSLIHDSSLSSTAPRSNQ